MGWFGGLSKTEKLAGAAVYEQLLHRGEEVAEVRVKGRTLDTDAALDALQKEREQFQKVVLAEAAKELKRVSTYLDKVEGLDLALDLPARPAPTGNVGTDLAELEAYAVQIQPQLEAADGKVPKPPKSVRLLAAAQAEPEPGDAEAPNQNRVARVATNALSTIGTGLKRVALADTENVVEQIQVDVGLVDGRTLSYRVPAFERGWSILLQTSSMLTSGVPAAIPLVPFVETGANAAHGVLAAVATLPALASGKWALAKSLSHTALKKLVLAVPSLVPVVSTFVNGTAAAADGKQAPPSR